MVDAGDLSASVTSLASKAVVLCIAFFIHDESVGESDGSRVGMSTGVDWASVKLGLTRCRLERLWRRRKSWQPCGFYGGSTGDR